MSVQKIEGDDYNIYQTIDLVELFGTEIENENVVNQIGQEIIDTIIERTKDNKSIDGSRLKKYSKEYIDSAEFEQYGKSPGDVNMELTGDMMNAIDITRSSPREIVIGFNDDTEAAKAANHNFGVTLPKRKFFGVNNRELEEIKSKFEDDVVKEETALDIENVSITRAIQSSRGRRTAAELIGDIFESED